jgi:hypothetical protein
MAECRCDVAGVPGSGFPPQASPRTVVHSVLGGICQARPGPEDVSLSSSAREWGPGISASRATPVPVPVRAGERARGPADTLRLPPVTAEVAMGVGPFLGLTGGVASGKVSRHDVSCIQICPFWSATHSRRRAEQTSPCSVVRCVQSLPARGWRASPRMRSVARRGLKRFAQADMP